MEAFNRIHKHLSELNALSSIKFAVAVEQGRFQLQIIHHDGTAEPEIEKVSKMLPIEEICALMVLEKESTDRFI